MRKLLLATSALVPLGLMPALANPLGGQVVGGSAAIQGTGTPTVTVTQSSQRAVINWNSFNIGAGEKTQFIQPNSTSTILNRVTGDPNPSQIYGTLSANGRVFIINPNGVLIGNGAVINTAGFLATTHDIANTDFMSGNYNFNIPGRPDASVVNLGTITATNAGFAALVAPGVRNSGTITASFGKIGLAAANGFSLDLYGDKLITLGVSDQIAGAVKDAATGETLKSLVQNDGKLSANGGLVQLSAVAARQVVDSVINTSGVIEARSIGRREGRIVLGGATAATKGAGAPTQTVKVSGKLNVASKRGKGGKIEVTGENIVLASATLDASGATGGGKVLIGGDVGGGNPNVAVASIQQAQLESMPMLTATTVSIDAASSIDASARTSGDGGKVVVWSDGATSFDGAIAARGGALGGNGGFAEVSGKQTLSFNGGVDLGAAAGKSGTLLLDPLNARIDTVAGVGVILVSAIQTALSFADVLVTTNNNTGTEAGDLTVAAPITWASENNLWLSAYRNVYINANITNTYALLPGGGDDKHIMVVQADNTGTGVGTVSFGPGAIIKSSGEINIAFNPTVNPQGSGVNAASYVSPTENFIGNVDLTGGGVLQQYMLVNTQADLQNMQNNVLANYALGRDINMTGVAGFAPIGFGTTNGFEGSFVGLNHTISNLTINSSLQYVGLFDRLYAAAEVTDLKLVNFDVTSTYSSSGAHVGTLAGNNLGQISDVTVLNSSVMNTVSSGANVGGLVGYNGDNLTRAIAQVSVTVGDGATAGGLVGANFGSISLATTIVGGSVTGGASVLGGLVGQNSNSIMESRAAISVDVTGITSGTAQAGGLVGFNDMSKTIYSSSSTGKVTSLATGGTIELGGLVGRNDGVINQSYSRSEVADTSLIAFAGGLVGVNAINGSLVETYATGAVTGLAGETGALIGHNFAGPGVTYSYWVTDSPGAPPDGIGGGTAGGLGILSADLQGSLPTGFTPASWTYTTGFNSNYPHHAYETESAAGDARIIFTPTNSVTIPDNVLIPPVYISFQPPPDRSGPPLVLISLGNGPGSGPGPGPGSSLNTPPGTPGFTPPPLPLRPIAGDGGERFSSVPPPLETRFFPNEVVVQVGANVSPEEIARIVRELGLSVITSQNLASLGRTAFRFRITNRRTVRDIIRALESHRIVATATPNYHFKLMQTAGAPAAKGDPAQYMLGKLKLEQVHKTASGKGVTIAVIDSEVDKKHTELQGAVSEELDTLAVKETPHSHGTAMVGAIASRDRLLGVAPGARILAVRAFGVTSNSADGTSYNILKGIEWAVKEGATVINMSFAGPRDPALERALKTAHDKGVVLVAAAGNAGPKSPPLYPGADPHVIAVTATDVRDGVFGGANRGTQLSVAAPGVDILAPAPEESYQMSTGTSIATAHVSGVVALMLERDSSLTPREVRRILESTATDIGPKGKDAQSGWGLVNPQKALDAVAARKKTSDASPGKR